MANPRLMADDDFRADALSSHDVHPVLRRLHWPEPETAKCRACGQRFLLAELTDDLLCRDDDEAVRDYEAGRI
jgi:hypothetical protein